jgi:hypothetical protein
LGWYTLSSSNRRHWVLISSVIALSVIAVLFVRTKPEDGQITPQSLKAPADAPATTLAREQISVARRDVADTKVPLAPSRVGNVADAFAPRSALPAGVSAPVERPLDILVTAPIQAAHGGTFEVSVGFPVGAPVRLAKFRVDYDGESLEVLNIIDATGTTLMVVPDGAGSVDLDFDTEQGAIQAPAIRFLARVDTPHLVQIMVTVDAWDSTGNALAIAPVAPYPIMLVP